MCVVDMPVGGKALCVVVCLREGTGTLRMPRPAPRPCKVIYVGQAADQP